MRVSFDTEPARYRHWRMSADGPVATLTLDVAEDGGITGGYELKMNSYDLGVDIELYDAVQRLRFEHPEVRAVVVTSGKDRMFCAGANIRMLAQASHAWKVNFCKFTNETRSGIEDATACSGQTYIAALNGTAAGGGYELALACDEIVLIDDGSSAVALPEVPLLGVLPGTGGLTRLVDKRGVRRDRADVFATTAEGVRGDKAVAWRLADETVKARDFAAAVQRRAQAAVERSGRTAGPARQRAAGRVALTPLHRVTDGDVTRYDHLRIEADRGAGTATIVIAGPDAAARQPGRAARRRRGGLAAGRGPGAGRRHPDPAGQRERPGHLAAEERGRPGRGHGGQPAFLLAHREDWLVNEIIQFWKRTVRRLDATSRSLFALIEPGSCFAGPLAGGGAGRRPPVHAGGHLYRAGRAGAGRRAPAGRVQPGAAAHGQRADPARGAVLRPPRPGRPGRGPRRRRPGPGRGRAPPSWAWSPRRPTTSTGTTSCGWPWRSGPASPPTR